MSIRKSHWFTFQLNRVFNNETRGFLWFNRNYLDIPFAIKRQKNFERSKSKIWWINHRPRHKYLMIMMFLPSIKSLFFMLLLLLLVLSQFSIIRTSTTINVDLMATADEAMSASASDSVEVGKGGQTSVITERYTIICTGSIKSNGHFRKLLLLVVLKIFLCLD